MTPRTYPARPAVGIGVCVLRGTDVLLIRRARPPALGQWSLPGGAQELGESVQAAARRELLEETAVEVDALHLAAVIDSIHHDAAGAIEYHYTIVDFAARWRAGQPRAGSDVSEAMWAPIADLDRYALWHEVPRVIAIARGLLGL